MAPPAVIVCFRPEPSCDRAAQLARLLAKLQELAPDTRVYVIEQSDDGRRFNRGALLNYGTRCALDDGAMGVVLHDCDLLPSDALAKYYRNADALEAAPVHIAADYERYRSKEFFGGIVGLSREHVLRINGFPNRFWGWGGEDQALRARCLRLGLCPLRARGTITDMEVGADGAPLTVSAKLQRLRDAGSKCPLKREHLSAEGRLWHLDGLNAVQQSSATVLSQRKTTGAYAHVVVQLQSTEDAQASAPPGCVQETGDKIPSQ